MSIAINDVIAERIRQIAKYPAEHDDGHDDGSIALAASCIADPSGGLLQLSEPQVFFSGWEKGLARHIRAKHTHRQRLVVAAAMLVAEIERLDRKAGCE